MRKLEKASMNSVDKKFHKAHDEVFANLDCLDCANCCKTMTPVFARKDIKNAAKALNMKPKAFLEKYVYVDDEDDYVLSSTPCPLLDDENKCLIYENRPKSCRQFPHTNRKEIVLLMDSIYDNTLSCPAALEIVNKIKKAK